jgi:hypothetical protein
VRRELETEVREQRGQLLREAVAAADEDVALHDEAGNRYRYDRADGEKHAHGEQEDDDHRDSKGEAAGAAARQDLEHVAAEEVPCSFEGREENQLGGQPRDTRGALQTC